MPDPVHVRLPLLLNTMFPTAERSLHLEVRTVNELFDALDARWPGMRDCLADSSPAVRRHINVFVGGRRVKLDAGLPPGADVYILTAISGG